MIKNLEIKQNYGIREVTPQSLKENFNNVESGGIRIIDVRRPEEFVGELGHIEGAELVTLGQDLVNLLNEGDRSETIVFVCRSGARSGQVTQFSQDLGYEHTANMVGGMILWNELQYPVIR